MIKVKLFSIFAGLLRVFIIFCICKYGFYREVQVSFPGSIVESYVIKETHDHFLEIHNPHINNPYRINITPQQAQCWHKNHYYIGKWYEMHLTLHVFWWIFIIIWTVGYLIKTFALVWGDCYKRWRSYPPKFDSSYARDLDLSVIIRCELYNLIYDLDFTPLKEQWYNFWGYETSSNIDDSKKDS